MKVVVYHGNDRHCDTCCCGHWVQIGDKEKWTDEHLSGEDPVEFAKRLVRVQFGEEHVKDLDWENCEIWHDREAYGFCYPTSRTAAGKPNPFYVAVPVSEGAA